MCCALYRRFDQSDHLQCKGRAQQIVLLGIEGPLNLLPHGRTTVVSGPLKSRKRGKPPTRVFDEPLAHLARHPAPTHNKAIRILLVPFR